MSWKCVMFGSVFHRAVRPGSGTSHSTTLRSPLISKTLKTCSRISRPTPNRWETLDILLFTVVRSGARMNPKPFCFPCVPQFKPLEQLMGVFPAASGNFLPETWRNLMSSPVSDHLQTAVPSASSPSGHIRYYNENKILTIPKKDFPNDYNIQTYSWSMTRRPLTTDTMVRFGSVFLLYHKPWK